MPRCPAANCSLPMDCLKRSGFGAEGTRVARTELFSCPVHGPRLALYDADGRELDGLDFAANAEPRDRMIDCEEFD